MNTCGGPTKKGQPCKQKVGSAGVLCWRHKEGADIPTRKQKAPPEPKEPVQIATGDCCICLENMAEDKGKATYVLTCGHGFHCECLEGLYKKSCPMCRALITKLPTSINRKISQNADREAQERADNIRRRQRDALVRFLRVFSDPSEETEEELFQSILRLSVVEN